MHGLPVTPEGYEEFTKAQLLHLQRQIPSHGFEAEQVARCLRKIEADETAKHRETLEQGVSSFNQRLETINGEVSRIKDKQAEPPKSEWRTASLWVAVIALGWQVVEKIPWRSLLPTPATIDAQKANQSKLSPPAHAPESVQPSSVASKSEAPVESSPPKAATESPLSKTPAEHPKE